MRTCLVVLLSAWFASGCSWGRSHFNDPGLHADVASFVPGVTTQQDVLDAVGSYPGTVRELKDGGELWIYLFGDAKTQGFNLILVNFQKTNTGIDTALMRFDAAGVLTKAWASNNSQDLPWEVWPFGEG